MHGKLCRDTDVAQAAVAAAAAAAVNTHKASHDETKSYWPNGEVDSAV